MKRTIALAGNPNSGKTTLFNALTGSHQKVGNWPGVTVERKSGFLDHADGRIEVVDLPGIYAIHTSREQDSIDEQIARDYLLGNEAGLVLNIVDAANLERNLYLTTQLLDAGVPLIVALNMMDVADRLGIHIDTFALSQKLGCPVIPVVATRAEGMGALVDEIVTYISQEHRENHPLPLAGSALEAMDHVIALLGQERPAFGERLLAISLLEGDRAAYERISDETAARLRAFLEDSRTPSPDDFFAELAAARYRWIDVTCGEVTRHSRVRYNLTDALDAVLLNRFLAFPLFLGIIYLMFMFTINLGSAFIDFFDLAGSVLFVEGPRHLLGALHFPEWLIVLLADGLGGGVQLVGTFIPVIGCLFLFLSFLEDSGYMARAAFIVDRLMSSLGLPGKSFVPLIVGFGCNVPAIMAARTLDNRQDRMLTTIMAPYMSCGARLTVYALFAAAFFPVNGQNVVFGLYLIGIVMAVLSGLVVRRFVLTGRTSPFIMELPLYHLPTLRGILTQTWLRLKGFVVRAGKAIVMVVFVLNVVNSIGVDGSFGNQDTENSLLSAIGKSITPLFTPMGVERENWPATVGIFTGIFAKEVVVGTLDTLYTDLARSANGTGRETVDFDPLATLAEAAASVPANLGAVLSRVGDPLGINIGDVSDAMTAAEQQDVQLTTLDMMRVLFTGQLGAFAYLLFILLYMPCVATIGAIYKEIGAYWAAFSSIWSMVMAYAVAVIVYQVGSIVTDPLHSLAWIAGMLAVSLASYGLLISRGRRRAVAERLIPLVNL